MGKVMRALLRAGILLTLTAVVATSAAAQEGLGGEAGAAIPTQSPVEPVDSASLMPVLYILTAVVAGVAVVVTVLLALGMGDLSRQKELSEGELRLRRLLKEDTGFTAGRAKTPTPDEKT